MLLKVISGLVNSCLPYLFFIFRASQMNNFSSLTATSRNNCLRIFFFISNFYLKKTKSERSSRHFEKVTLYFEGTLESIKIHYRLFSNIFMINYSTIKKHSHIGFSKNIPQTRYG